MKISRLSVERKVSATMVYLALLVISAVALSQVPLEFLPGMSIPWLTLFIPYPGSSPGEVEKVIAAPLEELLGTIPGIKRHMSTSNSQGAMINVQLKYGESVDFKAQEIMDKVDGFKPRLPEGIGRIMVWKTNTGAIPILFLGVSVDRDREALSDLVERNLVQGLLKLPGVAKVETHGLNRREIRVEMDLDALVRHGVNPFEVRSAVASALRDSEAGSVHEGGKGLAVRIRARVERPMDIKGIPVKSGVTVGDVARVIHDFPEARGDAWVNGSTAFILIVYKESVGNTVDVCRRVIRELEAMSGEPAMKSLRVFPFFNQGKEIVNTLDGLRKAGIYGSFLAVVVLYGFLRRMSATLIVAMAIPASIMMAIVLFFFTGITFNIVSMSGLIIGIGMLVDNAIVVIEAIMRRIEAGVPSARATLEGVDDIGVAVTCSTLTTVIVFLPLAFSIESEIGVYVREFGLSISYAIISSLIVGLTLIPLFTSTFVSSRGPGRHEGPGILERLYRRSLVEVLSSPKTYFLIMAVVLGLTVYLAAYIDKEGMPYIEQRRLRISVNAPEHFDFEKTRDLFRRLEIIFRTDLDRFDARAVVTRFDGTSGRLELFLTEGDEIRLGLEDVRKLVQEAIPTIPGVDISVAGEGSVRGTGRIEVSLAGYDMESVTPYVEGVAEQIRAISGITAVNTDYEEGSGEVVIRPDVEACESYGVTPVDIARTISFSARGSRIGWLASEREETQVDLMMRKDQVEELTSLLRLKVPGRDGASVPIDRLVRLERRKEPASIKRSDGKVVVNITAESAKSGMSRIREEIGKISRSLKLPRGCEVRYGMAFDETDQTMAIIGKTLGVALILIFLVMASLFESFIHPFVIMFTIPFGAFGVIWTLFLTDTTLNVMSGCGVLILAGIVVNNAIVLLDCVHKLRKEGMERMEAMVLAGTMRLRPILMTGLTTIFGLVPMVIGTKDPSSMAYASLARAVMGGLVSSTILALLFVPVIYFLLEDSLGFVWRIARRIVLLGPVRETDPENSEEERPASGGGN